MMTQEQADRFMRQCQLAMQEFSNGQFEDAVERLELLTIYFKSLESSDINEQT